MPKSDTQWKKGQSGNPSGRPKAIVSIVELARAQTEDSIKTLVLVRDNAEAPAAARVSAANALLDHGWGKPAQTITQNINDKRSALDWTTDELVAFLNECREDGERTADASDGEDGSDSVH
jgi:hypothetical protein